MALLSLKRRCLSVTRTTSTVAGLLLILGAALHQTHSNPLVYPNRFSFQKTTTTSSTPVPIHDHDDSNNSISSSINDATHESGLSTGRGFRYDIAAWVIGVIFVVCFLLVLFYQRRKEASNDGSSSCYVFPPNNDLKVDVDSTKIISPS